MKVELIITKDSGDVKRSTLLESEHWQQVIEDIKSMKGIDPHKEVIKFLKDELELALRYYTFN